MRLGGRKLIVEPFRYRGGDPRYRRPPPKGKRGQYRAIVSGISSDTTSDDLRKWAESEKFQTVALTDVYNRHGMSEGVIEFIDQDEFETAIKALDRAKFNGHRVRVYDERDYNRRKLKTYGGAVSRRDRDDRDRDRDRERERDRRGGNDYAYQRGLPPREPYFGGDYGRDRYADKDYYNDRRDVRGDQSRSYRGDNGYTREARYARSRTRSRSRDKEKDGDRYRAHSRDRSKDRDLKKSRSLSRDKNRDKDNKDKDRSKSRDKERKENGRDKDRSRSKEGRSRSN